MIPLRQLQGLEGRKKGEDYAFGESAVNQPQPPSGQARISPLGEESRSRVCPPAVGWALPWKKEGALKKSLRKPFSQSACLRDVKVYVGKVLWKTERWLENNLTANGKNHVCCMGINEPVRPPLRATVRRDDVRDRAKQTREHGLITDCHRGCELNDAGNAST